MNYRNNIKYLLFLLTALNVLLMHSCGKNKVDLNLKSQTTTPSSSTSIVFEGVNETDFVTSEIANYDSINSWYELSNPTAEGYPDSGASNSWVDMNGNVLLMHLDGTAGIIPNSTSVGDSSTLSNNGTVSDGDSTINYQVGRVSNAIGFDGTDDHIEIPTSASLDITGSAITIATWIYLPSSAPATDAAVICKGAGANSEHFMLGIDATGSYNFRTNTSGTFKRMQAGTLKYDEWTLLVGSYDGTYMKLYLNNQEIGQVDQTGSLIGESNSLYIGKRCGADNRYFTGLIDEVSIWDRALSKSEIVNIYTNQMQIGGTITSPIYNAETVVDWSNISWETQHPVQKELPNNTLSEGSYTEGNALMNGNIMLLHFNESSWDGTLNEVLDSSGNSLHGTSSGSAAVTSNGFFNNGGTFNGTSNYIDFLHDDSLKLNNGTISAWFKTNSYGTSQGIFSKDSNGYDNGGHINLYVRPDNRIELRIQASASSYILITDQTVFADKWYHVAAVFGSNQGMKVYIDSKLSGTNLYTGGTGTSSGGAGNSEPVVVGALSWASVDGSIFPMEGYFDGEIDELSVWNRDLSSSEILSLYKRGATKLQIQVRSCDNSTCTGFDFVGPDGTDSSFYSELNNNSPNLPSFDITNINTNQYFQYKVIIDSDDFLYSPELKDVSITTGPP